jgi:hypothetical protein
MCHMLAAGSERKASLDGEATEAVVSLLARADRSHVRSLDASRVGQGVASRLRASRCRVGVAGRRWEFSMYRRPRAVFLPSERHKLPEETLTDPVNVERICLEFWRPALDLLASV